MRMTSSSQFGTTLQCLAIHKTTTNETLARYSNTSNETTLTIIKEKLIEDGSRGLCQTAPAHGVTLV